MRSLRGMRSVSISTGTRSSRPARSSASQAPSPSGSIRRPGPRSSARSPTRQARGADLAQRAVAEGEPVPEVLRDRGLRLDPKPEAVSLVPQPRHPANRFPADGHRAAVRGRPPRSRRGRPARRAPRLAASRPRAASRGHVRPPRRAARGAPAAPRRGPPGVRSGVGRERGLLLAAADHPLERQAGGGRAEAVVQDALARGPLHPAGVSRLRLAGASHGDDGGGHVGAGVVVAGGSRIPTRRRPGRG